MTLKQYIEARGINNNKLAIELGISRQLIGYRVKEGYLVGNLDGVCVMYRPGDAIRVKPIKNLADQ